MDKKTGLRIRESRKNLGMTQQELGDKLNVSKTSIIRYEQGYVDSISTSKMNAMSQILKVDVLWLFGFTDTMNYLYSEEEFKDSLKKALDKWKDIDVKFSEADIQSIVEFIKFKAVEKWVTNTERHLPIEENVTM